MKIDTKDQEALTRPTPKSPIYSCEVIQTACLALEALAKFDSVSLFATGANQVRDTAISIIRDGLASQERAIKGES